MRSVRLNLQFVWLYGEIRMKIDDHRLYGRRCFKAESRLNVSVLIFWTVGLVCALVRTKGLVDHQRRCCLRFSSYKRIKSIQHQLQVTYRASETSYPTDYDLSEAII